MCCFFHHQAVCADILSKKAVFVLIQEQGEKLTTGLNHRERETVQQQLHHIGTQLDNLEKLGTERQTKLETCLPERKVSTVFILVSTTGCLTK